MHQLGSPRYRDREKAATELVRMGRAAKPALQEGKKHPDPEVRARCEQLLPQALALDLAFRVDRFLEDTDGKLEHDLPLLKTYREKVGTDENSRKLYAEMLKANGALLEGAEEEPGKVTERSRSSGTWRCTRKCSATRSAGLARRVPAGGLTRPNCAACCSSRRCPAYKPAQPDWLLANLYTQPMFTTPLKSEKDGTAYRKVFFGFSTRGWTTTWSTSASGCSPSTRSRTGPTSSPRRSRAARPSRCTPRPRHSAASVPSGTRDHVKVLEPFLKDATQVQPFFVGRGQRGEVKVKDVALAMTIHLSGKNPKDYGFTMWNVYPNQLIQYHQLGFGSDEERTAAFKKWGEERARPAEKKDPPKK